MESQIQTLRSLMYELGRDGRYKEADAIRKAIELLLKESSNGSNQTN